MASTFGACSGPWPQPRRLRRICPVLTSLVLMPLLAAGQEIRIDRSPTGATANGVSFGAVVGADGRFVAFTSDASNLVAGDANGRWDFFRYDRQSAELVRGPLPATLADGVTAMPLALSADGRWLLFSSFSPGWVPDDTNATGDVFQYDFTTATVRRVSVGAGGTQGNGSSSAWLSGMSADGRYVTFASNASNFAPPELDNPDPRFPFGTSDVFVADTTTGAVVQISRGVGDTPASGLSINPSISPDGEWVVFASSASNLTAVPDLDGAMDLYLARWRTGELWRIVARDGLSNGATYAGVATWDASFVLLRSSAMNLVPNQDLRGDDNFLWERSSLLVTAPTPFGTSRYGPAEPAISLHGRYVMANVQEFGSQGRLIVHYDRASGRSIALDRLADIWQMSADGRVVVYTRQFGGIYVHDLGVAADGLLPWLDEDGDGLPNGWEESAGLDPLAGTLDQGAAGDPDLDGDSNAEELAAGTHPRGLHARYFAEGAGGTFFDTRFVLANPGATVAHALLTFAADGGADSRQWIDVPPFGRRSVDADTVEGLRGRAFSTRIDTDVEVVAERTMRWGATAYGAHSETSTRAPSPVWYFAEGTTSGDFSLFYLLQNPQDVAVTVSARFLLPSGLVPIVKSYTLPARSRTTLQVDAADDALTSTDVAAHFVADAPIVVERAQYLSRDGQPFTAGHASAGAVAPALTWYLAEGATGPFFELFVLLMNPGTSPADCTVRYLTGGGSNYTKPYTLIPASRTTIWVDRESIPGAGEVLASEAVSTAVSCNVPVVVERTMWWPDGAWQEAHSGAGVTATARRWAVADGESGGTIGTRTFILVANTSDHAGEVRVTVRLDDGSSAEHTLALAGGTRTSLDIGQVFPWLGDVRPRRWWALVEALGPTPIDLIVERATYWNADGIVWAAGTSAPATPLP